jgi:hypothetical protein
LRRIKFEEGQSNEIFCEFFNLICLKTEIPVLNAMKMMFALVSDSTVFCQIEDRVNNFYSTRANTKFEGKNIGYRDVWRNLFG